MGFKSALLWCVMMVWTPLAAQPSPSLSLYGKAKHADSFQHYQHVNPKAPKGGVIKFGVVGTFDSLNPYIIKGTPAAGLTRLYANPLFVTLMDQSAEEPFSQYPYLAQTVELAEDRASMVYTLRQNATFHDGSPITSADVVFSFQTLLKEGLPFFKQYYGDVVKVEPMGKWQVKFTFKDGTNKELPLLLGTFPIFSKAYYSTVKFQGNPLKIPLGNGPYKISDVDPGRAITYEKVENWWGADLPVNRGRYNFQRMQYLYFRDGDVAFEAFKSRAYDIRLEGEIKKWVTGYDFPAVKEGAVVKQEIPFVQAGMMQGLFMNTRRPLFQDKMLRRALILALDFEWLNENYFYNYYERLTSFYWGMEFAAQGLPSTEELKVLEPFTAKLAPEVLTQAYTLPKSTPARGHRAALTEAIKLLKNAGYDIRDGALVNERTGQPVTFEILLNASILTKQLNAYIKNLERLGIRANLRIVDSAQYTERVEEFDYDMIFASVLQSSSPGNEQREMFGSKTRNAKGSMNYSGIEDPVVDTLIEQLIDASDRETLVTILKALDRVLLWGHYVVPFWGSSKMRMAYWKGLENSGAFPKYGIDLNSWWATPTPEKAS